MNKTLMPHLRHHRALDCVLDDRSLSKQPDYVLPCSHVIDIDSARNEPMPIELSRCTEPSSTVARILTIAVDRSPGAWERTPQRS